MRRSRWKWHGTLLLIYWIADILTITASQNYYKINPKPCTVGRQEGTCMFVWECIKTEGEHIGMCMDSFMFGSCCAHNASANVILSSVTYRPYKPSYVNKYKPFHSNRPNVR